MSFARHEIPVDPPEVNRHQRGLALDAYVLQSGLGSRLTTPENRSSFVEQLTDSTFMQLLLDMNGTLIDQPATPSLLSDHFQVVAQTAEDALAPFDVMPPPEDKQRLLRSVLAAAKAAQEDELKPLTLATGILAIHPFSAANGRVARGLYRLLTHDYMPGDLGLHHVLQADGDKSLFLDMILAGQVVYPELQRRLGTHTSSPGMQGTLLPRVIPSIKYRDRHPIIYTPHHRQPNFGTESGLYSVMIHGRYLPEMVAPLLLAKHPGSAAVRSSTGYDSQRTYFAVDEFMYNATDEDVEAVYGIYKSITRQYVQTLARTTAGLENQHLKSLVYINEGNGTAVGDLPTLLLGLAEGAISPNLAANDALRGRRTSR